MEEALRKKIQRERENSGGVDAVLGPCRRRERLNRRDRKRGEAGED